MSRVHAPSATAVVDSWLTMAGVDRARVNPASPASLRELYTAHVRAVPFCSATIPGGTPLDPELRMDGLARKFLTDRFGGVCFEHCAFLADVLKQLGFDARIVGGEVFRAPTATWTPPNAHAGVVVAFADGRTYLCDPGYPLRPLEPVPLEEGAEQRQADGRRYRVQREGPHVQLGMRVKGEWVTQHRTDLGPRELADFAGPARALSEPGSRFLDGWTLAICRPDGAHTSLATGVWAGAAVPPGHAKYVVRQLSADSGEVEHTEEVMPLGDERVGALAREEFRVACALPGPRPADG